MLETAPQLALSPLAEAMQSAFSSSDAISAIYEARMWEPVWTTDAGQASNALSALTAAIGEAGSHALPADRYDMAALVPQGSTPEDRVRFERAATAVFLAYATDIASGITEPRRIDPEIKVRPPRPAEAMLMAGIADASDPVAWLAGLAPADPEYARLRQRLAEMTALSQAGGWGPQVDTGPTLKPGMRGPRVGQLRARLTAMGDLPEEAAGQPAVVAENDVTTDAGPRTADPNVYDEALTEAVKRFQARHGLNLDGLVGPATRAAINQTAEERARAIAVNMERLRWMNRNLGDKRIMVNIAGFSMVLIENGQETFTSRVVVGKPEHQTPEFSDEMEHMVVNPTWNVPSSIATEEILPILRRDPGYLDRKNMELVGADPFWIDWNNVSASNFPGRIRQRPGGGNALGRVKFMFPNNHAIYLHDTPAKRLFAKDMRAYSHGCVRVEKPYEFARILLSAQSGEPGALFERLLGGGTERHVNLKEHIPVHIGYRTAWIDSDGTDQFRTDIYGRDGKVWRAMAAEGVSLEL